MIKMWICLFTCLAVCAIHLEWIRSLSAENFLNCLRRFIARRERPEWRQLSIDEKVMTYFCDKGIKWQFETALAPW